MNKKLLALSIVFGVGAFYFGVSWWLGRQYLAAQANELNGVQGELAAVQEKVSNVETDLAKLRTELALSQSSLATTQYEFELASEQLAIRETKLAEAESRLAGIDAGMFNLYDPTLDEALDFMKHDRTDRHEYIEDVYVCSHFAADVNKNAEAAGLRCAFVDIRFPDSAHAVIAFDTVDQGMVYFDPITDERVRPVIGKHYWKCIEPKPGYVYVKPEFDDTIEDIVVIW